jgi:TRAP-type mannitol/chloroaromatic compound transport system permease small subunit
LRVLERYIRVADAINEGIGRVVAWLTLGTVLVCFATVYLRYVLGQGYIWLQELYVWEHAIVFLVGAGYTLKYGGHVRVDVFYARASPRTRAWLDLWGTILFLFPFVGVILVKAWPYFWVAFERGERSEQPDGMPGLWVLKFMLVAFCIVVLIQAVALLFRCILVLRGREELMAPAHGQH